jgi:iron complex outermembrane receptor protein
MENSIRGGLFGAVAACAFTFAPPNAAADDAQDVPTALKSDVSSGDLLGEIVVTARRVEENVQTVPITIQAFSAEQLRESSVTETRDLMFSVPGIYLGGSGSLDNTAYYLRGQGPTGQQGHSIPGVESYFADVPLPVNAQSQPPYDLASIQVLKGPQGTLFGRNTVGGAVLIYPQAPTYDGVGGYLQVTGGNFDWREGEGALNLPLIPDQLALRVSGHIADRDGYVENISPGMNDGSGMHNRGFRVQLRWDPVTGVTNTTMFDYYHSDYGNAGIVLIYANNGTPIPSTPFQLALPNPAPPPAFITTPVLGTVGTGSWLKEDTGSVNPSSLVKQWGVTNHTTVDLGPIAFTNILAYREAQADSATEDDGTALGFLNVVQKTNERDISEEPQIKGSGFDSKLDWLAGLFYLKSEPLQGNVGYNVVQVPGLLSSLGPASYPFTTQESKAAYGHLTFHLDPLLQGLDLSLGYRYTWDNYKLCTAVAGAASPFNAQPFNLSPDQCQTSTPGLDFAGTSSGRASAPTWDVDLDWRASEHALLYATTRRGYRAGGLNGPQFSGPLEAYQSFAPERVTDIEFGTKTDWNIGTWRARVNLAVFRAVTDDVQLGALQVSTSTYDQLAVLSPAALGPPPAGYPAWIPCLIAAPPVGTGNSFNRSCNAAQDPTQTIVSYNGHTSVTKGLEFQGSLAPTDRLTLSAAATLYSFSFDPGAIPAVLAPYSAASGITDPGQALGARRTFTAGLRYRQPLGNLGDLVFNADGYWSGPLNLSTYQQPSFGLGNFRLDWNGLSGKPVDLSLFVRNAFDKHYGIGPGGFPGQQLLNPALAPLWTALGNPGLAELNARGAVAVIPGEPRTYGLQLRYRFGSSR